MIVTGRLLDFIMTTFVNIYRFMRICFFDIFASGVQLLPIILIALNVVICSSIERFSCITFDLFIALSLDVMVVVFCRIC